jgi:hypothetical protein
MTLGSVKAGGESFSYALSWWYAAGKPVGREIHAGAPPIGASAVGRRNGRDHVTAPRRGSRTDARA